MLGRLVKNVMQVKNIDYPLENIAHLFQQADYSIVNLECAITNSETQWHGAPKAFYFGAIPAAASALKNFGVDLVSLANNHILDFDYLGLEQTIDYLDEEKILHCGAGKNIDEAKQPAIFQVENMQFAMVAYCDHQDDFAASANTPGMNFLDLSDPTQAIKQLEDDFITLIQSDINWPILSFHWGPNMVLKPSRNVVAIAHAAIDIGYKAVFGHSAHVFHGVEIYNDCPIIYSAGDLIDDYYVDGYYKNDHGLMFECLIEKEKIKSMTMHPVFIELCRTKEANQEQFEFIAKRFSEQCKAMGTEVKIGHDHKLFIEKKF